MSDQQQRIWLALLPTLTFVAWVSAIQIELENTDKHDWHWIPKKQPGVLGVSWKINLQHDVPYY